jgi:hypothetical protein
MIINDSIKNSTYGLHRTNNHFLVVIGSQNICNSKTHTIKMKNAITIKTNINKNTKNFFLSKKKI